MRCAIYTRVSTEEQTQPPYSSLQTQQEICEHYIEVQREKSWQMADVYEDAGYSGKDLDRPAMQRLLYHVTQGKLDVVIAYKLDRISRSLKDFYDLWEVLKQHGVTFVSATQNFDTWDSAGNLMLNILLSFAQYERELTMERTATKMKARAQKGKWNGGWVPQNETSPQLKRTLAPFWLNSALSIGPRARSVLSLPSTSVSQRAGSPCPAMASSGLSRIIQCPVGSKCTSSSSPIDGQPTSHVTSKLPNTIRTDISHIVACFV